MVAPAALPQSIYGVGFTLVHIYPPAVVQPPEPVRPAPPAPAPPPAIPVPECGLERQLDAIAGSDAELAAVQAVSLARVRNRKDPTRVSRCVETLLRAELDDWRQALESARGSVFELVDRLEALAAREREPLERGGIRVRGQSVPFLLDDLGLDRIRQVRVLEERVLEWGLLARRHAANPPHRLVLE